MNGDNPNERQRFEARMVNIEEAIAHLENVVETLSKELIAQGRDAQQLRQKQASLATQLKSLVEGLSGEGDADEGRLGE